MDSPPPCAGTWSVSWTPTQAEFDAFAALSGDDNPIHVDPEFSARTRFGRTVSHGMLIYTKVFAAIEARYPGRGHALQTLMFPNPAYAGEELVLALTPMPDDPGLIAVEVRRREDGALTLSGDCRLGDLS